MEKKYSQILQSFGCYNIKSYCLINNWGYTFDVKDSYDNVIHGDSRFWENCYGAYLGKFQTYIDTKDAKDLSDSQLSDLKLWRNKLDNALNGVE